MIAHTEDYIDFHGTPTIIPVGNPEPELEEVEETQDYQPAPVCGQCYHLAQPKHLVQRLGHSCGFCPLLERVRAISDKPCKVYRADCPF